MFEWILNVSLNFCFLNLIKICLEGFPKLGNFEISICQKLRLNFVLNFDLMEVVPLAFNNLTERDRDVFFKNYKL